MFTSFGLPHVIMLLKGAGLTLILCVSATILGLIIGFLVGLGSTSKNKVLKAVCQAYVNVIRGIPLLVILFMIYFGIPMLVRGFHISQMVASIGGLTIYSGAYIGEIVRGNVESVPKGQFEASAALGFNLVQRYLFIILPQAIRTMIPALVGFLISLVKDSSLVSIIGYIDLTKAGKVVGNVTLHSLEAFLLVSILYFIICFGLSRVAKVCEQKLQG